MEGENHFFFFVKLPLLLRCDLYTGGLIKPAGGGGEQEERKREKQERERERESERLSKVLRLSVLLVL